MTEHSI